MLTVLLVLYSGITGCSGKTSSAERTAFAKLYAELLIVENTYRSDTVQQQVVVDSLLKNTDYSNREEIKTWIEDLTVTDPKGLQEMLDSTQKYLERIRDESRIIHSTTKDSTKSQD